MKIERKGSYQKELSLEDLIAAFKNNGMTDMGDVVAISNDADEILWFSPDEHTYGVNQVFIKDDGLLKADVSGNPHKEWSARDMGQASWAKVPQGLTTAEELQVWLERSGLEEIEVLAVNHVMQTFIYLSELHQIYYEHSWLILPDSSVIYDPRILGRWTKG